MKQLDPKAIWLFCFKYLLFSLIITAFLLFWILPLIFTLLAPIGMLLFKAWIQEAKEIMLIFAILIPIIGFLIFVFAAFWLSYFWAKLSYKNYKYQIATEGVKIEKGVIWKHYITIPFERIQNVDIYRGILTRLLGLSELHIQTAGYSAGYGMHGGWATEGSLPGLSANEAEALREELVTKVAGKNQG